MKELKNILKSLWHLLPIELRKNIGKNSYSIAKFFRVKKLAEQLAASQPDYADNIVIIGLFKSTLGHTTAVNLLSQELTNSNIPHKKYDVTELLNSPVNPNIENFENPEIDKKSTLIIYLNPEELIFLLWHFGVEFLKGKRIIGYWVWELDSIPKNWMLADKLVHEIWAPTEFCANVLRKRFSAPVKTVPHPALLSPPPNICENAREVFRDKLDIPLDAFVVVQSFTFASSRERKNILGAAKAFSMAFANDDKAYLIFRHLSASRFPNAFKELKSQLAPIHGNIILLEADGDINQLYDLYSAADLYISLHRAEGFGLNLAESMIIGVPVMATNWSGNTEFMNDESAILVPATLINVKDDDKIYKLKHAKWADADLEYAAKKLIELKNNPSLRKQIATNAKQLIKQKLSGGDAAKALNFQPTKREGQ